MERFSPRQSDVAKYRLLLSESQDIIKGAFSSVMAEYGVNIASSVVPFIRDVEPNEIDTDWLSDKFVTRDDFNRDLRYMERIKRESKRTFKGTVQMGTYGNLTAVQVDQNGDIEGAFVQQERRQLEQRMQRERLRQLEDRGIKMERVPIMVYDEESGTYKHAYSRSRHKLYTYVPATPSNHEMYVETINREPMLAIKQPEETPLENAYVRVFTTDEYKPVPKAYEPTYTPEEVATRVTQIDAYSDLRTRNYFMNYEAIVDATLPDVFSKELGGYIEKINDLTPAHRRAIYDVIASDIEDVGTLEYLYLDMSLPMNAKVQRIMNYWRNEIAPLIGADVPDNAPDISLSTISSKFEDEGIVPGAGQQIYDEYQIRKKAGTAFSVGFEDIRRIIKGA